MVTEEEIKDLAYRIWQAEGCPEGKQLDHYLRAKRMLEQRDQIQQHLHRIHPASWPVGGPLPPRKQRYW